MAGDPLAGITGSLDGLSKELRKARFTASRAGAEAIRKDLLDAFAAAGRARFRGSKVGVEVKQLSRSNGYVIGRGGRSAGAIAIGDGGTKPHVIRPRRGGLLKLPNGYAPQVDHPGARGTGMWDKGLRKGEPDCDAAVLAVTDQAFERGF